MGYLYDHMVKETSRQTAYVRTRGLKKFFSSIGKKVPGYSSPFEVMDERLKRKINRTARKKGTKKALNKEELRRLLAFLRKDETLKGRQNHAIVLSLVMTGLRSFELCQLRWRDVEESEGINYVNFVGKGGGDASQEIPVRALDAVRSVFKGQFGRDPGPEDSLFYSLTWWGKEAAALNKATMWVRLRDVHKAAKVAGVITRSLEFSAHLFRRTYATLLYKEGMSLKALQLKTRHSSLDILAKHYLDDEKPATPYLEKILDGVA